MLKLPCFALQTAQIFLTCFLNIFLVNKLAWCLAEIVAFVIFAITRHPSKVALGCPSLVTMGTSLCISLHLLTSMVKVLDTAQNATM